MCEVLLWGSLVAQGVLHVSILGLQSTDTDGSAAKYGIAPCTLLIKANARKQSHVAAENDAMLSV